MIDIDIIDTQTQTGCISTTNVEHLTGAYYSFTISNVKADVPMTPISFQICQYIYYVLLLLLLLLLLFYYYYYHYQPSWH